MESLLSGLAGENFEPDNLSSSSVGLLHGGIKNAFAGSPNVRAGSVTPNKWNYWVIRTLNFSVLDSNLADCRGLNVLIRHKAALVVERMNIEVFVIQKPRESKWKGVQGVQGVQGGCSANSSNSLNSLNSFFTVLNSGSIS